MTAIEKLRQLNSQGKFISVGLDTDIHKIPPHLKSISNPVLEFNKLIIEATKDLAAAYKVNLAFYEADGKKGLENIEKTLACIPSNIITIADGKRGDIGNTSEMYARAIFDRMEFDSTTINPLMGEDSVKPFLDYKDKLNFILTLTSNAGSADFQKMKLATGEYLFQLIISKVLQWNTFKNCGLVFGATNIAELKNNVNAFDELPILIPGVGAQGGNLEKVVGILSKTRRNNYLVNISRGILYKNSSPEFDFAARKELELLNGMINANL